MPDFISQWSLGKNDEKQPETKYTVVSLRINKRREQVTRTRRVCFSVPVMAACVKPCLVPFFPGSPKLPKRRSSREKLPQSQDSVWASEMEWLGLRSCKFGQCCGAVWRDLIGCMNVIPRATRPLVANSPPSGAQVRSTPSDGSSCISCVVSVKSRPCASIYLSSIM